MMLGPVGALVLIVMADIPISGYMTPSDIRDMSRFDPCGSFRAGYMTPSDNPGHVPVF